ncbi:hypothetical protein [Methyloferula stellata]|uniref:hypothetical protein n=1 Tax=Methyloferula stellata TaxID=876270 RepID=UPI00037B20FA|nr:hypothetical protein [Methyloferula stellata]
MSITDMIPTLDDAALANLRSNASRLEATGVGPRQKEAALLLPLIDAELATRKANGVKTIRAARVTKAGTKTAAPKKAAPKKAAKKVVVAAEADAEADDE